MEVESTKVITLTVTEITQAVAEWLSREHGGVMQDSTEFKYYLDGVPVESAPCDLGSVEVIVKES